VQEFFEVPAQESDEQDSFALYTTKHLRYSKDTWPGLPTEMMRRNCGRAPKELTFHEAHAAFVAGCAHCAGAILHDHRATQKDLFSCA
jgi:hypothetical protein